MKKHLLLLVGGLLMAVSPGNRTAEASVFADQEGFVIAKAVKLGRGSSAAFSGKHTIAPPAQDADVRPYECETNEECPSDKKCMGYKCVDVCTQPTGNGISYARICAGKKCILDPDTPHAFKCVDSCYNISCKSGYTTELTSNGCCCVPSSCPSGQRVDGYACVNNCAGVNCINGYFAVSSSKGCCCEPLTISGVMVGCASGYKLVNGKCVGDTLICPINCSTCSNGTCTKCKSGYWLNNGKCTSCPSNATCSGSSYFTCKSGYEKYNDTCRISSCDGISTTPRWCRDGYTRVEGKGCCPPGVNSNKLGACLQCAVLQKL